MVETLLSSKELKSIISRFNKNDLIKVISKLFPHIVDQLPEAIATFSKKSIVSSIHEKLLLTERNMDLLALQLDLQFVQMHSSKKMWHIFKLINVKEGFSDVNFFDPEFFMEKLETNLSRSKFQCKAYSEFYEEAIWTEVLLQPLSSRNKARKTSKLFLIHYPHLPYILHSNVMQPFVDVLELALKLIFKCRKVKTLKLNSRNAGTVLQLALQKDGYKFNGGPMPALLQPASLPSTDVEAVESPNVIDEQNVLSLNKGYMTNLYGTYQQPPLESLTIKTESSLFGDDSERKAKCRITFSGRNVIEGIRDLVHQNIIQQPLHYSLERLPQLARNEIYLAES